MSTIKEYIKIYSNFSFEECDFNINDVIIFSELSYINWSGIVSSNNKITLKEASNLYFQNLDFNKGYFSFFAKENIENLKGIMNSKRYGNIILSNYVKYLDKEKQFGALSIYFDKNSLFVSFEGTDDTVIGWKEDFILGYHFPIISQKYAIEYLNKVIDDDKVIYVGGHSKGGNLAMASSMYACDRVFNRIKEVYNLDGPGFREREVNSREFKRLLPKLRMYVPVDSIVGMLLYSTDKYKVVKSTEKGIRSHDCNTWVCFGSFLEEGKQSNFSKKINSKIKSWNKKYSDEELEKMIITFFNVLEKSDIKGFYELKKMNKDKILKILSEVNIIDDKTKKLYFEAIKELILAK